MIYSLLWLPAVLENAGLKVATVDQWETRGLGDMGPVRGVICHHTAGSPNGNMPSLHTLINGREATATSSKLRGPLAQLGLGRDGTFYVIAAGKCNHAGNGLWNQVATGNTNFIGIEAENTGLPSAKWPNVQIDAYQRGVAAILRQLGLPAACCAGHKEYATPAGRKSDPAFDMATFRTRVQSFIDGTATPPVLIPKIEQLSGNGGASGRETLRRGSTHTLVKQLQRQLGLNDDGYFGPLTEAAVRVFQRDKSTMDAELVPDGIVGPKTWAALDQAAE